MRRPIAARDATWAKNVAKNLARRGISPNAVSGASVVCAALAALCAVGAGRSDGVLSAALWIGAALCVQLRLLCNLFDGMLAVEWKKQSALGPLWNDFPDRPADALILVGCGFGGGPLWWTYLGWLAATLALMTAYTRVLGVAVGAQETFLGPMAKQHRMAIITGACVLSALESLLHLEPRVMGLALIIISVGCVITMRRRLQLVARDLKMNATNSEAK